MTSRCWEGDVIDFVKDFHQLIYNATTAIGKPLDESKYEIIDRGAPFYITLMSRNTKGLIHSDNFVARHATFRFRFGIILCS